VYGVLRTANAVTPFLTARAVSISLAVFCAIYTFIFAFGIFYIYRLLRVGPTSYLIEPALEAVPNRPMSLAGEHVIADVSSSRPGEQP
jgi:cytochrome d ubiquinol oxidase subunit I